MVVVVEAEVVVEVVVEVAAVEVPMIFFVDSLYCVVAFYTNSRH